jgi:uncharacterized membrane protein
MAMAMLSWILAIPVLGAMTGLRTMSPMAILCLFAWLGHLPVAGTWAFWAANPITSIVFGILALGELFGDKLPQTPNRTAPGPLVARVVFGGLVGAIAATGLTGSVIEGAILGAISALAGAFFGFHLRYWLVHHVGWRDLHIAIAEDVITIGCSVLAMGIVTG